MKQTEESLLARNRLAAAFSNELTIEVLKEFRERFVSQMKTATPASSDPYGINLHRYLGRIEAVDFIISEAEKA